VEQVIYSDHPHEVDWVDKGSELDRLSKEYCEHLKKSNELRIKYMDLDTENAKLKEKVRELEKRIRTENPEKRKIGTTKATIEMESEEFESLLKAIDFGAEWMNENGYSVQEKKFKAIYDKLKEL
jgi:predicted RNase H-like nuclease (RuvC/YqgF family)